MHLVEVRPAVGIGRDISSSMMKAFAGSFSAALTTGQ